MTDSAAVIAWRDYQDGKIDEYKALRILTGALDGAERLIATGEGQRALWRKRVEEIVSTLGGKASIDGLADYRITEPYRSVTYDRTVIEEVLHVLVADGHVGYAAGIEAARKVSERPGVLQIRKVKATSK